VTKESEQDKRSGVTRSGASAVDLHCQVPPCATNSDLPMCPSNLDDNAQALCRPIAEMTRQGARSPDVESNPKLSSEWSRSVAGRPAAGLLDVGSLVVLTQAGGQAFRKMLFGIRVVDRTWRPITASVAWVRAVGYLKSGLLLGLGGTLMEYRMLHDRVAGTRVLVVAR
jgi:hypothetical protein